MDDSAKTGQSQYVLFRLCDEEYGLPIGSVQSIIRFEEPTPVPQAPEGVEGVFNLRGQVLPLIDLGRRLRGERLTATAASRIIVAESGMGPVGLAVDLVHEVANIPLEDIKCPPAAALEGGLGDALTGVASYGDRLIILLDPEKALPRPVFASAGATQEGDMDV